MFTETNIIQRIEKTLEYKVEQIKALENVTNNSVYEILANGVFYIFKLYRSKFWPENGKLPFINPLLLNHHIPCAEIIEFSRDDSCFPNGYLLEKKLQGTSADKIDFSITEGINFYAKLAQIVSRIHRIPMKNFGYIGYGEAEYETMSCFINEEFDTRANTLIMEGIYDKIHIANMKALLLDGIIRFDNLPPVLCHGDLSTKNVIIGQNGDLALIDWDDAMSFHWMADVSRFTFWMNMNYSEEDFTLYKNTFMAHYDTLYNKSEFQIFEKAFHIFIGIDFLAYSIEINDTTMRDKIMTYLDLLV